MNELLNAIVISDMELKHDNSDYELEEVFNDYDIKKQEYHPIRCVDGVERKFQSNG